jgi:lipoprotein-releasing system ATP-binding protein
VALLRLNDISKTYRQGKNEILVLKDINLEIKAGEVVSLLGPSGSGKSTLLQIIGLVDLPTSGSIYIDDKRCNQLTEDELTHIRRDKIGYIYQFHHLLPEFTALENVMMPLLISEKSRAEAKKAGSEILKSLGLGDRLNNLPSELSGGEQQRVAVARALVHQPQLLLADEPTGNLDAGNGLNVMKMILNEAKMRKLAVILVTHNLELAHMTDRIFALSDGSLMMSV